MREFQQQMFTGERALFHAEDLKLINCIFDDGESPLKESRRIELISTMFKWKYPLWYAHHIKAQDCTWFEMARAGVWYSTELEIRNAVIQAPKNFRRCHDLVLENVTFTNAAETLWHCEDVELRNVSAKGDYFAMNCTDIDVDGFVLDGNYSFDGARNVTVRNARMLSKDSFWNCENVTVYDSFISGEYLGWNSRNVTLVNCTIESLQGMCYIGNLTMEGCTLVNTTLSFEYSETEATLKGHVDSILNPSSGRISADSIGKLYMEPDRVDVSKTEISCPKIEERLDRICYEK